MIYEIEIEGKTRRVVVEPLGGSRVRVTLDAQVPSEMDAQALAGDRLTLVALASGRSHEIGFAPGPAPGDIVAYVRGIAIAGNTGTRRARGGVGATHGVQRIVAPMPGKVLRVLVSPGDDVRARQPLVVVEAMKMENELSAPRDGRVTGVAVAPGVLVEAGRLLVVVE
jgi:biotin carboxyl carrier protein